MDMIEYINLKVEFMPLYQFLHSEDNTQITFRFPLNVKVSLFETYLKYEHLFPKRKEKNYFHKPYYDITLFKNQSFKVYDTDTPKLEN